MEFTGRHLIKLSRALKAMGFKLPDYGKMYEPGVSPATATKEQKAAVNEKFGMEVVQQIILGLGDAESEIGDLFGSILGMTGAEFLDLPMKDIMERIKPIFEDAGFLNFFKQAVSAMK